MRVPAVTVVALLIAVGQQPPSISPGTQPPRDVRSSPPTGTAAIRGRVIAADTGNPIRQASVNLTPVAPRPPASPPAQSSSPPPGFTMWSRQATTDANGAFEFAGLPAGRYGVAASGGTYSSQYLRMLHGAKSAVGPFGSDTGQPIELTEGQVVKTTIALPRGAVITGRVMDENGDVLSRVQVYTLFYPPGSTRGQRTGAAGQTDDLGQFRLFGLYPGEHVVVAEARGNSYVPPNAPVQTEEEKIGFMTTYYPGTADESSAQHVRARAGAETSGIEIRLVQGRVYRVSGTILDSQGRAAASANGQLTRPGAFPSSSFWFASEADGRFQMRSIPPGTYRLTVREVRPNAGGAGPRPQDDPGEMASMPVTIAGDVDDLIVTTGPGATITGHVVFEQGPPATLPGTFRIIAMISNPQEMIGGPTPPPASLTPDLGFTMKGLMGEFMLRASIPNQYLKSITLGGEDITDTPREFKMNDRVIITLTSRASVVEGSVTDARGAAPPDFAVVIFSDDKSLWRMNSIRTRRSGPDAEGHFRIPGLLPGRYLIAAVPRARLSFVPGGAESAIFEQLAKEATTLVLGDDEQRRIDLKFLENSGGQ